MSNSTIARFDFLTDAQITQATDVAELKTKLATVEKQLAELREACEPWVAVAKMIPRDCHDNTPCVMAGGIPIGKYRHLAEAVKKAK